MKRGIITLLSVLALAITFAGCSGENGSSVSVSGGAATANGDNSEVVSTSNNKGAGDVTATIPKNNDYGINSALGTPPMLPSS